MWQQFVDATGRMSGQAFEHVLQVAIRIVSVEFAGSCRGPDYAE
jgi:hypothetical protein